GLIVTKDLKFTLKTFASGMTSVAPALILIVLAVSVKIIITEGMIMDPILYQMSVLLSGQSAIVGVLFIFLLVLLTQFFIGSASAKAFLIMPLILPLVQLIGISKELSILAFVFADGYTNVIFPTNSVLLIGLSIASVSYAKWFKFTIKLQILTLLLNILFLIIAVFIGY
ncbi:MAG: AbgT family transporter, partial [Acholeplasmataceae bacterium]|nr:AbgT family transporter [Acholeplasmataceae bacterium]